MKRPDRNALLRRARLVAHLCLLLSAPLSLPARAQCQTWAQDPALNVIVPGSNSVYALTVFDEGTGPKLWVGGHFGVPGAGTYISRWNGQSWMYTGALNDLVYALCPFDSGQGAQMYAGGWFSFPSGARALGRWTGTGWVPVGNGLTPIDVPGEDPRVEALAVYDPPGAVLGPELYVAGIFKSASGAPFISKGIIRWNGSSWSPLGAGLGNGSLNPYVHKLTVYDNGSDGGYLYAAGDFTTAGGQPMSWLARWDGTSWSSVGGGVNDRVTGLAVWDDGSGPKLYVSGVMTTARGVPVTRMAIWNGVSWSTLPTTPWFGAAEEMVPFDDGRGLALFVGTNVGLSGETLASGIGRWDGTSWSSLGGGINGSVRALATYDDGSGQGPDLYVGGFFYLAGGGISAFRIARWIRCPGPIDSICPGDQTLAACPCANHGVPGHGCQNSTATGGAELTWHGTTSPDTLRLTSSGELPSSLSIFLQGSAPTSVVMPFGDGLRCTGGMLLRLYVTNAVGGLATAPGIGNPSISASSAALGDPLVAGDVRLYQAYYRDPLSPCGSSFNVSNGVRVVW